MSQYDPKLLAERALQWRAEAEAATFEAMRAFCLKEALWCERRIEMGLHTPVFLDATVPTRAPGDPGGERSPGAEGGVTDQSWQPRPQTLIDR